MPTQSRRPVGITDSQARYNIWKNDHLPLLYDWVSSRRFMWPHAALRWGTRVENQEARGRHGASSFSTRSLYLAERTGTIGNDANTLLHCEARIVDEHASKPDDIARPWSIEPVSRMDIMSTPDFYLRKRIVHPGEVNKIRLVAPDVVVTHTDSPDLYLWDLKNQPHRRRDESRNHPNTATCTLAGHSDMAEYALSVFSTNGPYKPSEEVWIASGGSEREILIWKLRDYESTGRTIQPSERAGPQNHSQCHQNTIEDVSFNRVNRSLLASVGQDKMLIVWDFREGSRAASVVRGAHGHDINSCDFSGVNEHLIVTGSTDLLVKVWDIRYLMDLNGVATPCNKFSGHVGQVNVVSWNKYMSNVFASGADDGHVCVWDRSREPRSPLMNPTMANPALLLRHVGHAFEDNMVVDLEWQPDEADPWCLSSLSETVGGGGSTLQIWRMSDLLYRPQDLAVAELRRYSNLNGR